MDDGARLVGVDNDARCQQVARDELGGDARVEFVPRDGLAFLNAQPAETFDFAFADAWPGKYERLDAALALVGRGGLYVGDGMPPQPNWPDGRRPRVAALLARLESMPAWAATFLDWASGIVIGARR